MYSTVPVCTRILCTCHDVQQYSTWSMYQASQPRYHVVDWSDTYFKKKLSVIIVFLVYDGLFEHFLIKKTIINVEIRENENIQIPFWTHVNVLFRTCYRMYSYVKFKAFSFFYQKIIEIHKKGPGGFIGEKLPYLVTGTKSHLQAS